MPPHDADTLFGHSRGKPWSGLGFRHAAFRIRDALAARGLVRQELTIHGLRTTVGPIAADLGYSDDQIADGFGHRDTKSTKGYVREAGRTKNLKRVIEDIAATRREQRCQQICQHWTRTTSTRLSKVLKDNG